jgi:hypothetical protein
VRKLSALLAEAASVGGCAVAPGYGEAQPYDSVYGYPFYGPGYGTSSISGGWSGWGGGNGWYGYHWYGNSWHGAHGRGHGRGGGYGG